MKNEQTCTIIIPSNTAYIDICNDFLKVFRLAWKSCPYRIVFSLFGENKDIDNAEYIYNGEKTTITKCVYEAALKNPSDLYLIFLPDAFFCGKINQKNIERIVDSIKKHKLEYCMLRPKKSKSKIKPIGDDMRYISRNDRYCHSFISFAATMSFIKREFSNDSGNDLDFELRYLNKENEAKTKDGYYIDHSVLTKDYFHIRPGIEKGKWNRNVLKELKRKYPCIAFSKREVIDRKTQLIITTGRLLRAVIPDKARNAMKKIYNRISRKSPFITND